MTLGLIAGNGRFPFLVLEAARSLGHDVIVFAIRDEAFPDIEEAAAKAHAPVHWISIGELGRFLQLLKDNHVTRALMAGQVKHVKIFGGFVPDMTALSLLTRIKGMNTDALIGAVADLLREHGVELINSAALLEPLLAGPGQLSHRAPSEQERQDLEFGYPMADTIAGKDIGQTIAVKHRAVVAVEAMEGTDETIARAGHLAGGGVTIIKVAKPNQDMRFDVPIVGLATIQAMRLAGATCLSVDAGRTLMFDRDALLASANDAGIAIVGRAKAVQQ